MYRSFRILSFYHVDTEKLIKAINNKNYTEAYRYKRIVNSHTFFENTALTDAAKRGNNDGVKFLVQRLDADINDSCDCPDYKTALHYASEYSHIETVKLLISLGANIKQTDSNKLTPDKMTSNEEIKKLFAEANKSTQEIESFLDRKLSINQTELFSEPRQSIKK
jgi:ankyrin repeat protein